MSAITAPEQTPVFGAVPPLPEPAGSASVDAPRRAPLDTLLWLLVPAAVLSWVTFYARGGIKLEPMTIAEIVLTLLGGAAIAAAIVRTPPERRWHGLLPLALMIVFTALTALSIAWSVQPDDSWIDAGRMFAYVAVFAVAVAGARLAPARWEQVLGAVALAMLIVCAYALLTKVFPASLDASDIHARLEQPFGYWNATGLAAAMGIVCWLWVGSRRTGNPLLGALSYPAVGLLIVTLILAYSRGALAALALGLALWFAAVPLRLRGAAVLAAGVVGAAAVVAWDFSTEALTAEGVELARRTTAGHQLGVALLAMVLALTAVGVAARFATDRHSPSPSARHAAGMAIAVLAGLAVLGGIGALTMSSRGLTGTISHTWNSLTDPNAKTPPNTAGRLTAVASVRARYWKEALEAWSAHPLAGVGAEGYATARLRYRTAPLDVRHAHGFIVQTLADLGLIGLLVALALLAAWMAAAGRATHPFNRRWAPWRSWSGLFGSRPAASPKPGWHRLEDPAFARYTPERIGLLSMICVVAVFGVHSLVDWTWYVPGNACVALLCAGWLAGRGSIAPAVPTSPPRLPAAAGRNCSRAPSWSSRYSPHGRNGSRKGQKTLLSMHSTCSPSTRARPKPPRSRPSRATHSRRGPCSRSRACRA